MMDRKRCKCKLYNDKGMSLIELVVVIAIMAVMIGVVGFSLSFLIGAEARQAARKMDAELNDIKTGAMSRASEYMLVRYIEVTSGNEAAYAKLGVDRSGYYAEKHVATIDNKDTISGSTIKLDYGGQEYTRLGSKKVKIMLGDKDSGTQLADDGTVAFKIEYERSTGKLKDVEIGTISSSGVNVVDVDFTSGSSEVLNDMYFTSGLRTYHIKFDAGTGKHSIE